MKLWQSVRLYSNLTLLQLINPNRRNYLAQWDNYWRDTQATGEQGNVLWDVSPELAAKIDMARFKNHINPALPLLDLGCGNGRQTRFLAQQVSQVIGVDVSAAAIALARQETIHQPNLTFRVLDATDPAEAKALHDKISDMNVYIRGVVHVIQKRDRPNFVASLSTLLGTKGVLYQTEVDNEALPYFRKFPGDSASGLPALIHRVVKYGITPVGFNLNKLHEVYAPNLWTILERSNNAKMYTIEIAPGQTGAVPANYLIARAKLGLCCRRNNIPTKNQIPLRKRTEYEFI